MENLSCQNDLLAQYFRNLEEMEWALEVLSACGLPLLASLCIGPRGDSAGILPGECAVRMAR